MGFRILYFGWFLLRNVFPSALVNSSPKLSVGFLYELPCFFEFVFSGSAAVAAGQSVRRPGGHQRAGESEGAFGE